MLVILVGGGIRTDVGGDGVGTAVLVLTGAGGIRIVVLWLTHCVA